MKCDDPALISLPWLGHLLGLHLQLLDHLYVIIHGDDSPVDLKLLQKEQDTERDEEKIAAVSESSLRTTHGNLLSRNICTITKYPSKKSCMKELFLVILGKRIVPRASY